VNQPEGENTKAVGMLVMRFDFEEIFSLDEAMRLTGFFRDETRP
jgi:hypothetical protein